MAQNTLKCNLPTPLHFKGLTDKRRAGWKIWEHNVSTHLWGCRD